MVKQHSKRSAQKRWVKILIIALLLLVYEPAGGLVDESETAILHDVVADRFSRLSERDTGVVIFRTRWVGYEQPAGEREVQSSGRLQGAITRRFCKSVHFTRAKIDDQSLLALISAAKENECIVSSEVGPLLRTVSQSCPKSPCVWMA